MDILDPVRYSIEEVKFLLENVGTPPVVAFNRQMPEGVNPRAVRPLMQEVYDRMQLQDAQKVEWVGVEKVKSALKAFLDADALWEADWKRSKGRIPRWPTMYSKDGKGKYHMGGPGADSDRPRTWIDAQGNRHRFEINLDGQDEFYPEDVIKSAPKELIIDEAKSRVECPICHHTETYKQTSRASFNAARARMSRHLKQSKDETSLHRELHTNEFGA